jgi:hypothetical protein
LANQDIKFDSLASCVITDDDYILVTKQTASLKAGETIEFQNRLDGDPTATIQFFYLGKKDLPAINAFCNGSPGLSFSVPGTGSGKADCVVTAPTGMYEYTIAAPGHHTLDPVIIVEPNFMLPQPVLPVLAFVLGVGAMKMYQVSKRK